jgi:hypothetical protein
MACCLGSDLIMSLIHVTQHKRFVSYGTHPNFCGAKTSFIRKMLGEILSYGGNNA